MNFVRNSPPFAFNIFMALVIWSYPVVTAYAFVSGNPVAIIATVVMSVVCLVLLAVSRYRTVYRREQQGYVFECDDIVYRVTRRTAVVRFVGWTILYVLLTYAVVWNGSVVLGVSAMGITPEMTGEDINKTVDVVIAVVTFLCAFFTQSLGALAFTALFDIIKPTQRVKYKNLRPAASIMSAPGTNRLAPNKIAPDIL